MEHVLEIQTYQGRSFITLNKERYTLGRSQSNCIVIKDSQVSRYHATLIRHIKERLNDYYFIIYDGNLKNKKSRNGLIVNEKLCSSWILENNDLIKLGDKVKLKYYQASAETLNLLKISYRNNSHDYIFADEVIDTTPSSIKDEEKVDNAPSFIKKTIANLESSSLEKQLKILSEKYKI